MSFVVHCHESKGGRLIEKLNKEKFGEAIDVSTDHEEAKFFKIFSHEWTHHMEGERLANNYVDWVRVE